MALATQCPHCGTLFRVAADQLKLRGGIVRCGACQQIFDGNAGLVDLNAPPPPRSPGPARAATPAAPASGASGAPTSTPLGPPMSAPTSAADDGAPDSSPVSSPVSSQDSEQPVYTLEFDRALSPLGILPHASTGESEQRGALPEAESAAESIADSIAGASAEPMAAPPAESTNAPIPATAAMAQGEQSVASAAPDAGHAAQEPSEETLASVATPAAAAAASTTAAAARQPAPDAPPLLLRESAGGSPPLVSPAPPPKSPRARAAEARSRRSKLTPTRIEDTPKLRVPEIDEPEFVRRGRQREQSGKAVRIAMMLASVLLLVALVLQSMVSMRDVLAARYPALRPVLVSTCALFGCTVGLPARPEALVIETGELITLGGNAYTLSTVLRNGGDLPLAWPSIELTLNDLDDKPLVRRVFGPRDYAPQVAGAAAGNLAGFGARAEQPVKIHFKLEGPQPSGYHIAVFYP